MATPIKYVAKEFVGKKFYRWTILREIEKHNGVRMVEAQCECGVCREVVMKSILRGLSKSCGCHSHDAANAITTTNKRLYGIYCKIKGRCYNQKDKAYRNYGGRGIRMCDEWLIDFKMFHGWAINNGYDPNLEIDRINNDGNYEPSNCRWTTPFVQARNRRTNLHIEFNGETKLAIEWAEQYAISQKLFHKRRVRGWSIERALTTPRITTFLPKDKKCQ